MWSFEIKAYFQEIFKCQTCTTSTHQHSSLASSRSKFLCIDQSVSLRAVCRVVSPALAFSLGIPPHKNRLPLTRFHHTNASTTVTKAAAPPIAQVCQANSFQCATHQDGERSSVSPPILQPLSRTLRTSSTSNNSSTKIMLKACFQNRSCYPSSLCCCCCCCCCQRQKARSWFSATSFWKVARCRRA